MGKRKNVSLEFQSTFGMSLQTENAILTSSLSQDMICSSVVAVAMEGMAGLTGRWCVFLASRARYVHYYLADD